MKTSKTYLPNVSFILILFSFLSLSLTGCGDDGGSTGTNPDPTPPGVFFDSGSIAAGGSYSYTFNEEGTVEYYCTFHIPDMQGEVTVNAGADISGNYTITMDDMAYSPSSVTVAPGTTIEWVNEDEVPHTVTSGNPSSGNGGNPY